MKEKPCLRKKRKSDLNSFCCMRINVCVVVDLRKKEGMGIKVGIAPILSSLYICLVHSYTFPVSRTLIGWLVL